MKIGNDIGQAKLILENNGLVAIPTETVYGLSANAFNPLAVAKIFEAKQRPSFDPLIVHTNRIERIDEFVVEFHPLLKKLALTFWPGPLTLLLPKKNIVPDIVTSGLNRVGVRIPNHELTLNLLSQLNFPLAAPSANPFGYISPTSAMHVQKQLGDRIDYIIDGGLCGVGLESTIVGEENNEIVIYRLGGLSIEEIENVVGKVHVQINHSSNPKAPGQLKSHYAPKKPVFIGNIDELLTKNNHKKIGLIVFGNDKFFDSNIIVKDLSPSKCDKEAASNLFSVLRELDDSNVDVIVSDLLPLTGLGMAINDRLIRASAQE